MDSKFTDKRVLAPVSDVEYETPDDPFSVSVSNLKNEEPLGAEEVSKENSHRSERKRACLDVLNNEKSDRRLLNAIRLSLQGLLMVFSLLIAFEGKKWNLPEYIWVALITIGGCISFLPALQASDKQSRAFRELLEFDDLSLTGTFVEELPNTYSEMLIDTQTLLTELLFRFKEKDAHLLNRRHRRILLSYMGGYPPYHDFAVKLKFRLSILHALSFTDDRDVLSHFKEIARGKYCGQDCPELASAAQESVSRMRSRIIKLKESDTLLRASSSASAPDNELLRPVEGGAPTVDEELLRPME